MPILDVLTLDGWLLDYFTGKALGHEMLVSNNGDGPAFRTKYLIRPFEPSLLPDDMLPVLQRMCTVLHMPNSDWQARVNGCSIFGAGPTVSLTICRALVVAAFGMKVPHPAPVAVAGDCEDLFA